VLAEPAPPHVACPNVWSVDENRPLARLCLQAQLTTLDVEVSKRVTLPVGPRGLAEAVLLHDPPTPAELERAIDSSRKR